MRVLPQPSEFDQVVIVGVIVPQPSVSGSDTVRDASRHICAASRRRIVGLELYSSIEPGPNQWRHLDVLTLWRCLGVLTRSDRGTYHERDSQKAGSKPAFVPIHDCSFRKSLDRLP